MTEHLHKAQEIKKLLRNIHIYCLAFIIKQVFGNERHFEG